MNQNLMRLARKLNNFTINDLALTLEENPDDIQKELELLIISGKIKKYENGIYIYSEEKSFKNVQKPKTRANTYYRGVVFTDEELQKLEDEMKTSQLYLNSHKYIQKKVNKYVSLVKAANGLCGRRLEQFIRNDWNKKHPEMRSSKEFYIKSRKLLKTYGIEALIPLKGCFPKHSLTVSDKLYLDFKEYLLNNRNKTLKTCYMEFKDNYLSSNPNTEDSEFPSYRAITDRVQKDILESGDKVLSEMYQPRQKAEIKEVKKSGFTDFKSAAEDFFNYLKNEKKLKKSTIKRYNQWINQQLTPFFDQYRLDEITEEIIEEYKAKKTGEQFSQHNIWSQMFLLRRILTIYTPEKYVPSVKTSGKQKIIINILDKNQVKKLVTTAKNSEIYPIVMTALLTGMTSGEIFALSWDKIDWKQKQILVNSYIFEGRIIKYKTSNVIRKINIPELLIKILKKWRNKCPESHLIFPDRNGNIQDIEIFARVKLTPAAKKAGIDKIRFMDLRDTYASLLIEQKIPITYIQFQLGISSVKAVADRYKTLIDRQNPKIIDFDKEIFSL